MLVKNINTKPQSATFSTLTKIFWFLHYFFIAIIALLSQSNNIPSDNDCHILCNDFEQDAVTRKTQKHAFFFKNFKFRWALKPNQYWDTFWCPCVFRSIFATFTCSDMSREGQFKMTRKWARSRFHSYTQHTFQEPGRPPSPGGLCLRVPTHWPDRALNSSQGSHLRSPPVLLRDVQ